MAENTGSESLIGKQLGDYKLIAMIAEGGMAKIYRAMDIVLERDVAVKVLTAAMVDADTTLAERFQREAKAVARLEHENIIPIYRAGEQDGYYYLAMKLIQGKDLADELHELKQQYKLMNPRRMLHIMEQVAAALDYAHREGVVHRDVKPSNILIDETGKAVLSDFGLVLRLEVDKTMGTAFGTPRYISPEQALASERALPASDIYSLAVIVYEILTGQMLFEAENAMQIALSHISEIPRPPTELNPDIPSTVEREVLKALEKDPAKRHTSAGTFVKALKDAYGDALPSPREIAPELAQSHTPVMDTPPDFEKIAAEQRQGAVVKSPAPTPIPAPVPSPLLSVGVRTPLLTLEDAETVDQRGAPLKPARPSRKRYRLFLLVMIFIVVELLVVAMMVADEEDLKSPPTWIAELRELFSASTDTPTPTDTQTPTDTETPTCTYTPEPTGIKDIVVDVTKPGMIVTRAATDTLTPTDTETPTATPTATDTASPTDTQEPTATVTESPAVTPEPTVTVTPYPTDTQEPAATGTATSTETEMPTATNTRTPRPTHTRTPTATPASPTETVNATVPVFAPGEGEPVTLFYDFSAFALRNDGAETLAVTDLVIKCAEDVERLRGSDLNLQVVPPETCVVIVSQSRPGAIPEEWGCETVHNRIQVPTTAFFWRQTAFSDHFQVFVGASDEALVECSAIQRGGEDTCEFNWPILEEE